MGSGMARLRMEKINHSRYFYDGVKAAQEGRYCVAEIYFENALQSHPARDFWEQLYKGMMTQDIVTKLPSPAPAPVDAADAEEGKEAAQPTEVDGRRVLELPMNERAAAVLDYLRLSMNILHTYLCLAPDRVNGGIALAYCLSICAGARDLNHLVSLWCTSEGAEMMSAESIANTANVYKRVEAERRGEDPASISMVATTLTLFQTTLQYYWASAAMSYCVLSLQYVQNLEGRSVPKHRARVYDNVLDLSSAAMFYFQGLCERFRYMNAAKEMGRWLPNVNFSPLLSQNMLSHNGLPYQFSEGHTGGGKQGTKYSRPSIFKSNMATQAFFYHGRRIRLDTKLSPYVREAPIRLVVKTQVSRIGLARILSAGKRNTFFYIGWLFKNPVSMVPGHSMFYLRKDLPEYIFKLETKYKISEHRSINGTGMGENGMIVRREALTPVNFFSGLSLEANSDEEDGSKKAQEEPEKGEMKPLTSNDVGTNQSGHQTNEVRATQYNIPNCENSYLNFKDDRILRLLALEEAFLVHAVFAAIRAVILKRKKYFEDAEQMITFVKSTAQTLYGPGSFEAEFLSNMSNNIII